MPNKDPSGPEIVALLAAIDKTVAKVHTQSLDLSFNELLDMYQNKELDISPDYQRLFQWPEGARSRFIESLLLEMPVPPIYVVEENEGRYMLIDGLQRISSYLHLRGHLSAEHLDPPVIQGGKLVLTDCDIVPELNGRTYDELGTALQIRLKRAFVRVEVVRKGSDPRFKYFMFKRLNTGGQALTPQQVRNCTIRLLDPTFNDFIIELSKTDAFAHCTDSLTQDRKLGAFDQELVLRFFAFKNRREQFKHDVDDFFTEYMEAVSDPANKLPFDYPVERDTFLKTFTILEKTLAELSFTYANKARTKLTGGFSAYHYEAITVGLQSILDKLNPDDAEQMKRLRDQLLNIKLDPEFITITTGGGKNSAGLLRERIDFVKDRVVAAL
jgi:Protein of unknown function DUF262